VTVANVPGGAIVERELVHTFVQERADGTRSVRLLLKKPDLTAASQLALQVNATALTGPGGRADVAAAVDGGVVEVRIPSVEEYRAVAGTPPPVDFHREPVRWLEVVLNKPVSFFAVETASVVINDATKTVSWTGEVRLREGSVALPAAVQGARPSVFHCRDGQRLSEFMEKNGPALAEQQLVDVVKALNGAGLIKAEVRSN
jgi:flagellar basal body P-ring protein FlgI